MPHPGKARILIVSQYSFPENKRNMNAYQRIFYGSRYAAVVLLLRRGQPVSQELRERVQVHYAPFWNRWLFLAYAVLYAIAIRFQGAQYVLTEPSGFAAVGFLAKYLAGYFWVMDVWDRPRWRTGYHEAHHRAPLEDRFVFWLMGFADLYLLSCLPRAAKDIKMDAARCVQLYNAINLQLAAKEPPRRGRDDEVLHVAYARSRFHWTVGLDTVIEAGEILSQRNVPAIIHLVGHVREEDGQRIAASPASQMFKLHGFTAASRIELFRTVHVGLAAYKAYEDLSYIFPIKVLEHLSQGNPVIVSRLPGLCAMVQHGYNGLVVEPGDPASLAEAIARLQADRDLFNRLAQNALQSVRKFDVEEKNRKIFDTILNWKKK
jgi:glycosyltransferase involved in cell wall biosynthesis